MLTKEAYDALRARIDAYESARKQFDPKRYERGGGYSREDCTSIATLAGATDPTNEEKSAVEVYEFVQNPPDRYFAYVKGVKFEWRPNPSQCGARNIPALTDWRGGIVTTWTGDKLGDVVAVGDLHRGNMGDVRIPLRVKGINGVTYSGIFYASTGDYCRLRRVKGR